MIHVLRVYIVGVVFTAAMNEYHNRVIYVNEFNGTDNEACLSGYSCSCRSLEFVAHKLGNGSQNVTIVLDSSTYLNSQITFEDNVLLTIKGKERSNIIDCNQTSGGISFVNVRNLLISNTGITRCIGQIDVYHATIMLYRCFNVTIFEMKIEKNTNGSAMVIVNPFYGVNITESVFLRNGGKITTSSNSSFASGLHIQFSEHNFANITIKRCKFGYNKTPNYNTTAPGIPTGWNGHGLGGGIGLVLLKNSTGLTIHIDGCTFDTNNATWGAGLCIYLQQHTFNNRILITNSTFKYNHASQGGGGVQIRLGELQNKERRNFILFQEIIFEKNHGKLGGGTSITALFSSIVTEPGEILQFINCTWTKNNGPLSPAVDISPYSVQQSTQGYLPIPLFKDSFVLSNSVHCRHDFKDYNGCFVTQGVFAVTKFFVCFQGYLTFKGNNLSALYLTSGRAIFGTYSDVLFHSNQAIKGGGIAMYGFSTIIVNDSSKFRFINNSATRVGGGISYVSSDQHEYYVGRTCFLEYGGSEENTTKRGISFVFHDNKAPLGGLSIYSESLLSCYYAYYKKYIKAFNLTLIFDRIGTFTFDVPSSGVFPLATAARSVFYGGMSPLVAAPGETVTLPFAMHDEFAHLVHSEYALRLEGNKLVHLDNYFTANNQTRIYGESNQVATLVLSTPQPLYNVDFRMKVLLLPCSPGFYYDELAKSCKCSADNESHTYPAITKCINFRAFIKHNYWVGYYPSNNFHPDYLYTAFYPSHFNRYNGLQKMPTNSNNLSNFICETTKEGALCGKCKANYSAYYHSRDTTCGENQYCKFGILFYLLSEVIPMAVFFTFVMMAGVNFSSSAFNGFVFFSQVVDIFAHNLSNSQMKQGTLFSILQSGYQLIYGIFNFNYFTTFSFCLWKSATIMDVIVFKYVTFTCAFALIILTVFLMNYSNKYCSRLICNQVRRRSSVTHGISSVLILCYGQCTRVGFFILTKTYLRGKTGVAPISVTYYGGLPYFGNDHLPYAILAIIFTFVLVGLPPVGLIVYPFLLHLLEKCGLSEHKLVERISKVLCVSRFVPLFDSFQSCYKDKLRCFAGLYFLYRVVAYIGYMYGDAVPSLYFAVLMLGIHSIVQPYKSWKHNIIDALLFLNIATINSLTIMIKFSLINEDTDKPPKLELIQLFFIYLPILTFLLILVLRFGKKVHSKCKAIRYDRPQTDSPSKQTSQKDVTHTSVDVRAPLLLESSVRNYM